MKILASIPARAVYAAREAPALPEESSTARLIFCEDIALTKIVVPRSLKEPVGLRYSHLKNTFLFGSVSSNYQFNYDTDFSLVKSLHL